MATTVNNLKFSLTGIIIFTFCFSVLGQLGNHHWFFDLFSHFSLQFFFINLLFLPCLLFLFKKNYALWILVLLSLLIHFLNLWPFYYHQTSTRSLASKPIKVVSINLNSANDQYSLLNDYLAHYDPDIVFLLELTPALGHQLSALRAQFPYGKAVMENGNFGIGIISKIPLNNVQIQRQDSTQIPYMTAQIQFSDQTITVIAAHAYPPLGEEGTLLRNSYTDQISQFIQNSKTPTILCGDFNASPWSHQIKKIIKETGMILPQGQGVTPTWPSHLPFLRIPIDFCMTSKSIHSLEYSRGPYVGSDHYPFQMVVNF